MVTPNSSICVKSDAPSRPGGCCLREEHFPRRTLGCTPHLHPPLQRAHLPVLKPTRILPLQELKDRLRLKPALSSNSFCQSLHTSMNGSGRVRPRTAAGNSLGTRPSRDTSAPSSRPSLPWTLQSPGSPLSLSTATNLRTCLSVTNPPPLREPEYAWPHCRWIGKFCLSSTGVSIVARTQGSRISQISAVYCGACFRPDHPSDAAPATAGRNVMRPFLSGCLCKRLVYCREVL